MDHGTICSGSTVGSGKARPDVEQGFTYIAVLIFIAIMGVGLAAVGEAWSVQVKRDREEELLFAGDQIRNAIVSYGRQNVGGGRYPTRLEDLLKDPRFPATRRYLRKIYLDPMTNSFNWELVKGPNGELLGVHSRSDEEPLKIAGFSLADRQFGGATRYSDWVFVISPTLTLGQPAAAPPVAKPAGPKLSGAPGVNVRR